MTHQLCTFQLGNLLFGMPVLQIQEVVRLQKLTRVPLATACIRGLINLRGQIVTAIDFRTRLQLPPLPSDAEPVIIVVRTTDGVVCLLVDNVGEVVEFGEDAREPAPGTLAGIVRDMVTGVFRLKEQLLIALDVEAATCLPETAETTA